MDEALEIIGTNIAQWWSFMWDTDVPGTVFSFGSLYMFILIFGVFLFLIRTFTKDKEGD